MAIEFTCKSCASVLRVSDQHAGKHAKCPSCSNINLIPDATEEFATAPAGVASSDFSHSMAGTVSGPNPFQSPQSTYVPQTQFGSHLLPHRGAMVFTLGMVSVIGNMLMFCVFLFLAPVMIVPGIIAWTCGSRDLAKINAGEMDPTGRSLTQAGLVLGIIGTVIGILELVLGVVIIVLFVSSGAGF